MITKDQIKAHIKKHKVAYSVGGTIVVATLTTLVVRSIAAQRGASDDLNAQRGLINTASRGQRSGLQRGPEDATAKLQRGLDTSVSADVRPFNFFSKNNNNIVQVVERNGRGHPGYLVENSNTGELFRSQNALAKTLDVPDSVVSGHLTGKLPDILGEQYARVGTFET